MMKNLKNRLGFSMIEVIFVIIILGIVSSIGAEIIAKVYENYIVQRGQHRASLKTQLALKQIENRLKYVIPDTLIRRESKSSSWEIADSLLDTEKSYTVLQWVGSDNESFQAISTDANRKPGWSAFCDLNASDETHISTPGSNLGLADTIINNLSGGTASITNASIFFPNDTESHAIHSASDELITLENNASRIVERYKLAWTSYALAVEEVDSEKNLYLYYNFAPVVGIDIPNDTPRQLLLKNITTFKFKSRGDTIRIKICVKEKISDVNSSDIRSCKEKAVF